MPDGEHVSKTRTPEEFSLPDNPTVQAVFQLLWSRATDTSHTNHTLNFQKDRVPALEQLSTVALEVLQDHAIVHMRVLASSYELVDKELMLRKHRFHPRYDDQFPGQSSAVDAADLPREVIFISEDVEPWTSFLCTPQTESDEATPPNPPMLERQDAIARMVYSWMDGERRVSNIYSQPGTPHVRRTTLSPESQPQSKDIAIQASDKDGRKSMDEISQSSGESGSTVTWNTLFDPLEQTMGDARHNTRGPSLDTVLLTAATHFYEDSEDCDSPSEADSDAPFMKTIDNDHEDEWHCALSEDAHPSKRQNPPIARHKPNNETGLVSTCLVQ